MQTYGWEYSLNKFTNLRYCRYLIVMKYILSNCGRLIVVVLHNIWSNELTKEWCVEKSLKASTKYVW